MIDAAKKIAIFGSAGHAIDVADICLDAGYQDIVFLTMDENRDDIGGYHVHLDTKEAVEKLKSQGFHFAIGIGSSKVRKVVYDKYPDLGYPNLIHSSVVFGNIQKEGLAARKGNIFASGSKLTNNIEYGDFCFIGVNAVIGHDCIMGNYTSIMPGAVISGNVELGQCSYVGAGASIIQGDERHKLTIGQGATIGMGAAVIESVIDGATAVGVPARIIKS